MEKGEWTFITNHGRILAYLAKHPKVSAQQIAFDASLSIRAVSKIILDLKEGGYISWEKEGRNNHYTVHLARPMRHRLEQDHNIGDVLLAIGATTPEVTTKHTAV